MKACCGVLYHFLNLYKGSLLFVLAVHLEDWAHYLSFAVASESRIYLLHGISIKLQLVSQLNIDNNELTMKRRKN